MRVERMPANEKIDELMLLWEDARGQGREVSAAELCADCPELADELDQRIRAVVEMERVLGVRDFASPRTVLVGGEGNGEHTAEPLPTIPGYEVVRVIGQGGMGVVYEAVQLLLGRRVAIKMISGPRLGPKLLGRFQAEAEAAARLQHPNVLQIFEVGQVRDRPFFSMEYVDGGTLAQLIAQEPIPVRRSAELVDTLARAVHTAHAQGIIHRDLKPANILLSQDGTPKIADFGLAKLLDADSGHTQTGEVLGTPSYMAPEQAEGMKDIGPGADVWALGAILYELLTRRPPFQGASALDSLRLVTSRDPIAPRKLNPSVPPDLEAICLKCLEKSVARRYASAQELADDLRRFLDGKPVVARRIGPVRRAWRWVRRHPFEALAAVVVVVVVSLPVVSLLADAQHRRQLRLRAEERAPLVREILHRNCSECHDGAGRLEDKRNFDILDHAQLLESDRSLVVPGRPEPGDSRLIRRIADGSMPPEKEETRLPRLSETELTILSEWILGGAPPFPREDPQRPTPPVVPYSSLAAEVRDIFEKRCYECHKYDVAEGGIKILHHRLLLAQSKVVIPGRPDESELFQLISTTRKGRMPPEGWFRWPLTKREIETVRQWIEEGAPPFPKAE
jgi:predicted Ser/Thr protein kinase